MSMDPALRLEQRKVLMGPDHPELGLYPEMSTLMYGVLCFSCTLRIWDSIWNTWMDRYVQNPGTSL